MSRTAIAAMSAIATVVVAFLAGFVFGAWCDASDLIEWED